MKADTEKNAGKHIWIDLENSPHVPFFVPIIKRFHEDGHSTKLTARDCFQVCGLADYNGLSYVKIGRHYGKKRILKAYGALARAMQLIPVAIKARADVAIAHGSRSMMIAARILGIPIIEIADYEFTYHIPFLRPEVMIVPEVISACQIAKGKTKLFKYPGIKEDVYVPFFKPDGAIRNELKLGEEQIIVTIRPPATEAHYHNPESEILFAEVLNRLGAIDNLKMIILPRNEIKQTTWIKEKWPDLIASGKILMPFKVVDGLNLIWHSDFVVSGGGTMNREAAALGVPVYSIFKGKIGAVDNYLSANKRLTLLKTKADVSTQIIICKRTKAARMHRHSAPALESILASIYASIKVDSQQA